MVPGKERDWPGSYLDWLPESWSLVSTPQSFAISGCSRWVWLRKQASLTRRTLLTDLGIEKLGRIATVEIAWKAYLFESPRQRERISHLQVDSPQSHSSQSSASSRSPSWAVLLGLSQATSRKVNDQCIPKQNRYTLVNSKAVGFVKYPSLSYIHMYVQIKMSQNVKKSW